MHRPRDLTSEAFKLQTRTEAPFARKASGVVISGVKSNKLARAAKHEVGQAIHRTSLTTTTTTTKPTTKPTAAAEYQQQQREEHKPPPHNTHTHAHTHACGPTHLHSDGAALFLGVSEAAPHLALPAHLIQIQPINHALWGMMLRFGKSGKRWFNQTHANAHTHTHTHTQTDTHARTHAHTHTNRHTRTADG